MFDFGGKHISETRFGLGLPEDILKLRFINDTTYMAILWSGDVDMEDTRYLPWLLDFLISRC